MFNLEKLEQMEREILSAHKKHEDELKTWENHCQEKRSILLKLTGRFELIQIQKQLLLEHNEGQEEKDQ